MQEEAVQWASLGPLAAVSIVALVEAVVLPVRWWAKGAWVVVVLTIGALAGAATVKQQQQSAGAAAAATDEELSALHGLWTQWETIAQSLPAPTAATPDASFDTIDEAVASLSAEVANIQGQIEVLRNQSQSRSVDADTATKLADYLRQYGAHRVVVSCAPDDVEAYTYANQIATILRNAGWDAPGPEMSGSPTETGMALSLFVRDPRAPDTAKILVDAFSRFNIPYHSAIAPNEAIPDTATAEIHVAKKS
jgi:hypothetical protein